MKALIFCLSLYGISSSVAVLSSYMYWLCIAEVLAMSRLQILTGFFFKSAADISCNYLSIFFSFSHNNLQHAWVQVLVSFLDTIPRS
jgi:hypothetical protein